jgi:monofunctional biosynthetic peptidoglycan transglycosylase
MKIPTLVRAGCTALVAAPGLLLAMNAHASDDVVLFDFRAATNAAAWRVVNDDVMGGVSSSRFEIHTNGCAIFHGEVSLENYGSFASVRSPALARPLAACHHFRLRVRGDGRRYKFTLRADDGFDGPLYQQGFATRPGEWIEVRLPLREFIPTFRGRTLEHVLPLQPGQVKSVGFLISDKQAGPFRLEIESIRAVANAATP